MRAELENKLYAAYPALYAQHTLPMDQTNMCWGFQCGDGWYNLIDRLSFDIAKIIATNEQLDPKLCTVSCVKEKFGGLRFHIGCATEEILKLVSKASEESFKICETCGGEGTERTSEGWIRVICDSCEVASQKKREEERMKLTTKYSEQMELD